MSMYEAFKKAGEGHPEFAGMIELAKGNLDKKQAELELERHKEELEKYLAARRKYKQELVENEKKRRELEQKLMSELLPFKYSFRHMGEWSCCWGIILAKNTSEALERAKELARKVQEDYKKRGGTDPWFDDFENFKVSVEQIDLSTGVYGIAEYYG